MIWFPLLAASSTPAMFAPRPVAAALTSPDGQSCVMEAILGEGSVAKKEPIIESSEPIAYACVSHLDNGKSAVQSATAV